jgi:hypothetical protein
MRRGARIAAAIVVAAAAGVSVVAQRFPFNRPPAVFDPDPNARYDARFAFARLKYTVGPGGYYYCGLPSWAHGYAPCRGGNRAETSLMRIMNEVSYLNAHVDDSVVLAVDDPELFKYPIAYIIEVGWWTVTDREATALRAYLQKGGFLFVDDFKPPGWRGLSGGGWEPFAETMRRVLPDVQFLDMMPSDPVFHAFFEINDLDHFPQAYVSGNPIFKGIFEDNDRRKRLMAIINYNTDVSQFWEWSGRGLRPFDQTNEAYKLGVNYLIYGLTH